MKFLYGYFLQKASMGGSKRKNWIDLVEMASIGKPYESATAIDFEARFWLCLASRSHLQFSSW